jgi:hypothetical protein
MSLFYGHTPACHIRHSPDFLGLGASLMAASTRPWRIAYIAAAPRALTPILV